MAEPARDSLYERDFYAWTQEQAARLRALHGVNTVDIEHVAEEIEDLGRAQLNAVESHLEGMLVHLLKLAASTASAPRAHWRQEVLQHQSEAERAFTEAMRQRIDVDRIWRKAVRRASVSLVDHGEPPIPEALACPFTLEALLIEAFDPDRAERVLRAALASTPQANR